MCLELLEKHRRRGAVLLDVGTGSGILAIAGVKLGFREAWAIDNDPVALSEVKRNALLNRARSAVHPVLADLHAAGIPRADVVTANIDAPAIVRLCARLGKMTRPGSWFLCSGFTTKSERKVIAALRTAGLRAIERMREEEWSALAARRA